MSEIAKHYRTEILQNGARYQYDFHIDLCNGLCTMMLYGIIWVVVSRFCQQVTV